VILFDLEEGSFGANVLTKWVPEFAEERESLAIHYRDCGKKPPY
jgi:hypothetical protein